MHDEMPKYKLPWKKLPMLGFEEIIKYEKIMTERLKEQIVIWGHTFKARIIVHLPEESIF